MFQLPPRIDLALFSLLFSLSALSNAHAASAVRACREKCEKVLTTRNKVIAMTGYRSTAGGMKNGGALFELFTTPFTPVCGERSLDTCFDGRQFCHHVRAR